MKAFKVFLVWHIPQERFLMFFPHQDQLFYLHLFFHINLRLVSVFHDELHINRSLNKIWFDNIFSIFKLSERLVWSINIVLPFFLVCVKFAFIANFKIDMKINFGDLLWFAMRARAYSCIFFSWVEGIFFVYSLKVVPYIVTFGEKVCFFLKRKHWIRLLLLFPCL